MAKTKVMPLRIPEGLDELAALAAKIGRTDKATVLRQWLYKGAELGALKLMSEGQITKGYAGEMLDLSIYEILDLAERYGIELGPSATQQRRALDTAERIGAQLHAERETRTKAAR
jgi:hypothetical protein